MREEEMVANKQIMLKERVSGFTASRLKARWLCLGNNWVGRIHCVTGFSAYAGFSQGEGRQYVAAFNHKEKHELSAALSQLVSKPHLL
ncbi:hypothetical protein AAG906_020618 [Vitis piasezkii]